MTIEERLDAVEREVARLREMQESRNSRLPKLEDSMSVVTHAQRIYDETIAEHKAWLAELSKSQAELRQQLRESDARTEKRIADLVIAIGKFMAGKN
jgi:phage-related minor tail protein